MLREWANLGSDASGAVAAGPLPCTDKVVELDMESEPGSIAVVPLMSLFAVLLSDIEEPDEIVSELSRAVDPGTLPLGGELEESAPEDPDKVSLMLKLLPPTPEKPDDMGSAASSDEGEYPPALADELVEPALESREDEESLMPPVAPLTSPPIAPEDTESVVSPRLDALPELESSPESVAAPLISAVASSPRSE